MSWWQRTTERRQRRRIARLRVRLHDAWQHNDAATFDRCQSALDKLTGDQCAH